MARFPAEWEPQRATWTAWPYRAHEWGPKFGKAKRELAAFITALTEEGDAVRVLVRPQDLEEFRQEVPNPSVHVVSDLEFGDSWCRDTLPIYTKASTGLQPVNFAFNGWGGRFLMQGDESVGAAVARWTEERGESGAARPVSIVLEGGSVDSDGEGTLLTTEACLLNPNRNPGMTQAQVESELTRYLGATKVLWLKDGLLNDHTDGHVDTLARFVEPGHVLCMSPADQDDPNYPALEANVESLSNMVDAAGRGLSVHKVPSPGLIRDAEGRVLAASYANFVVSNRIVVVPTYGVDQDKDAVARLSELMPSRTVIGLSARAIVEAGGAFHCLTQQQPL